MNSSVENSIYKWHACRKCFLVQLLYKYLNTMNTLKQVKNTLVYMKRIKQTATGDLSTHFKINFYDTEINNGSSKTKKLLFFYKDEPISRSRLHNIKFLLKDDKKLQMYKRL